MAQGAMAGATAPNGSTAGPLSHAFLIDATGRPQALPWSEATAICAAPERVEGWIWLHLDRSDAVARRWLTERSGLTADVVDALTEDDTRPRVAELDGGVVLILRGLDRTAKGDFEPPISVRVFVDARRVISVRLKPFSPTAILAERMAAGQAPSGPGRFVARLMELTLAQLEQLLDRVGRRMDEIEVLALSAPTGKLRDRRGELLEAKRAVIVLERFMGPQREALNRLAAIAPAWLPEDERPGVHEAAEQAGRIREDLSELRERATLIRDEMHARLSDRMNRTMVTLAGVSTLFLPLTFLTGLLGSNLAGIPYAEHPLAFAGFVGVLGCVAIVTLGALARINRP